MPPQKPPLASTPTTRHVTALLERANSGDAAATDELLPVVYDELRTLAAQHLSGERPNHTLQPTALVHEAYMRLVGPGDITWQNRAHFFGAAARAIRRILIDHARTKNSAKRGGNFTRVALDSVDAHASTSASGSPAGPAPSPREIDVAGVDMLALDDALKRLAEMDPQKSAVVELRFFGGLTAEETATSLGVSESTVARDWAFARAWLHRELSEPRAQATGT